MRTDEIKANLKDLPIDALTKITSRLALRYLPFLSCTKHTGAFYYLNPASVHRYDWTPRSKHEHLLALMIACMIGHLSSMDRSFIAFLKPSQPKTWWRKGPAMRFFHATAQASAACEGRYSVDALLGAKIGRGISYLCENSLTTACAELEESLEDTERAIGCACQIARPDYFFPKHPHKAMEGFLLPTREHLAELSETLNAQTKRDLEIAHSQGHQSLLQQPLWTNGSPSAWNKLVFSFDTELRSMGLGFEHWADWYQAILSQRQIELIQMLLPLKRRMTERFDEPLPDQTILQINQSLGTF